jgi:hypothetical protein
MYFCGDPDSWDPRSLMIGMGGMRGGMMGGMGGGMMGGMGGMMGGMGGGMRSVPPTDAPSALLNPGQTRHLPTRLVSLSAPDAQGGIKLPEDGEPLRLCDIAETRAPSQVQKALARLAADKASTSLSQLVMWRVSAGLEWETIRALAAKWANGYELTLAKEFVEHLETLPEGEAGSVFLEVDAAGAAGASIAEGVRRAVAQQQMLGLVASIGIPERPDGASVYCRLKIREGEASVQVGGTDARAQRWIPFGKFTVPFVYKGKEIDFQRFADDVAGGVLNQVVRTQVIRGPRENGKPTYRVRIDNASPFMLSGLAAGAATSKDEQAPKVLYEMGIPPHKSMTVPASEEVVKSLGVKKGIRVVALDLSAL